MSQTGYIDNLVNKILEFKENGDNQSLAKLLKIMQISPANPATSDDVICADFMAAYKLGISKEKDVSATKTFVEQSMLKLKMKFLDAFYSLKFAQENNYPYENEQKEYNRTKELLVGLMGNKELKNIDEKTLFDSLGLSQAYKNYTKGVTGWAEIEIENLHRQEVGLKNELTGDLSKRFYDTIYDKVVDINSIQKSIAVNIGMKNQYKALLDEPSISDEEKAKLNKQIEMAQENIENYQEDLKEPIAKLHFLTKIMGAGETVKDLLGKYNNTGEFDFYNVIGSKYLAMDAQYVVEAVKNEYMQNFLDAEKAKFEVANYVSLGDAENALKAEETLNKAIEKFILFDKAIANTCGRETLLNEYPEILELLEKTDSKLLDDILTKMNIDKKQVNGLLRKYKKEKAKTSKKGLHEINGEELVLEDVHNEVEFPKEEIVLEDVQDEVEFPKEEIVLEDVQDEVEFPEEEIVLEDVQDEVEFPEEEIVLEDVQDLKEKDVEEVKENEKDVVENTTKKKNKQEIKQEKKKQKALEKELKRIKKGMGKLPIIGDSNQVVTPVKETLDEKLYESLVNNEYEIDNLDLTSILEEAKEAAQEQVPEEKKDDNEVVQEQVPEDTTEKNQQTTRNFVLDLVIKHKAKYGYKESVDKEKTETVTVTPKKKKASTKALGTYDELSEESKQVYDRIMKKRFTETLNKLSDKELEYLNNLYQVKAQQVIEDCKTNKKNMDTLTEEEVALLAVYVKINNRYKKKILANQVDLSTQEEVEETRMKDIEKEMKEKIKPSTSRR